MLPDESTAFALSAGPSAYGLLVGLSCAGLLALLYQHERLYRGLFIAFAVLTVLPSALGSPYLGVVVRVSEPEIFAYFFDLGLPVLLAVLPPVLTCLKLFPVPPSSSAQSNADPGACQQGPTRLGRWRQSPVRLARRLHHAPPADDTLTAPRAPERNG